ncbi:MAG: hypothetical protein ACKV0T_24360 [Planctomycetales bacterium]
MPLPHLHLFHPPMQVAPLLPEWLASVEDLLRSDANWDGCEFHRLIYDGQAAFDVPTAFDRVNRFRGPVIVIQKVQARLVARFQRLTQRRISLYSLAPLCPEDIWLACETARLAFEDGAPRIPVRELIAFLIVRKLETKSMWGGSAMNKSFLWADDLPKGGFPKDCADAREILQTADVLFNAGILSRKLSEGSWKYALGAKDAVHSILDAKAFDGFPKLQNYFAKSRSFVPAQLFDYNDG